MRYLQQKLFLLEKKCEDTNSQKDDMKLLRIEFEYKLQKKKAKVGSLKKENEEILRKLENYIDKDSANKQLMIKKNWEFEKDQLLMEENSKHNLETNEKLTQENTSLKEEIKTLGDEIENLKQTIEAMKKKLNDEFMKNKRNTKKILNFKSSEINYRRSNTSEKNEDLPDLDSTKSLKNTTKTFVGKSPTEEHISIENEEELRKISFDKNEPSSYSSEENNEKKEVTSPENKKKNMIKNKAQRN